MTTLEKLIVRQQQVGYYNCESLNINALLGLITEASKAIQEWIKQFTPDDKNFIVRQINHAVWFLETLDDLKNKIRDKEITLELPTRSSAGAMNWKEFDEMLGHVMYYLNALAMCRGKKLEDYIELAYEEIAKPKWDHTTVAHCVPLIVNSTIAPK